MEQDIDVLRFEQFERALEMLPVFTVALPLQPLVGRELCVTDNADAQRALLVRGDVYSLHFLRLDPDGLVHGIGDPAGGREHNGQRGAGSRDAELFRLQERNLRSRLGGPLNFLFQKNPSLQNKFNRYNHHMI